MSGNGSTVLTNEDIALRKAAKLVRIKDILQDIKAIQIGEQARRKASAEQIKRLTEELNVLVMQDDAQYAFGFRG